MNKAIVNKKPGAVILVQKPYKWTSFEATNKLKWLLKQLHKHNHSITANETSPESLITNDNIENNLNFLATLNDGNKNFKIGHAGTLDPLATGLLIICIGSETKNIEKYQQLEKEYTGTFFIGATTPCFDLEKPIDKHFPIDHITNELIDSARLTFTGTQLQTPPLFSAVRIAGKRAYEIAREGKSVELQPKEITIYSFETTAVNLPEIEFKIICSKGTYIRSVARDFGLALNSGAHLTSLHRSRIGAFTSNEAIDLNQLEEILNKLEAKNVV